MVKKTNLNKVINMFVNEVNKHINVNYAYLFGSYLEGRHTADSDIDIAIVSNNFSGFKYEDRKKINPFILKINTNIEVHPFTLEEFKIKTPFLSKIIKSGKLIFSK